MNDEILEPTASAAAGAPAWTEEALADIRENIQLVDFGDRAVIVNTATGAFTEIDRTAAAAFRRALDCSDEFSALAGLWAMDIGLDPVKAEPEFDKALRLSEQSPLPQAGRPERRAIHRGNGKHRIKVGRKFTAEYHPIHLHVQLGTTAAATTDEVAAAALTLAPQMLTLAGIPIINASAVEVGGKLYLFSGVSGAGKSAMARALARAGAEPIADDLVVLDIAEGSSPQVMLGGETTIKNWARDAAGPMTTGERVAIDFSELIRLLMGENQLIERLVFLDAGRRDENHELRWEAIGAPEAFRHALRNGFTALGEKQGWIESINTARGLANGVPAALGSSPKGIEVLDVAARAWLVARRQG